MRSDDDEAPRPWELVSSQRDGHMILFRPRWDEVRHPLSQRVLRRLVLETPEWVNVIARDAAGRYVMVEQYRFGTSALTLEIPGGMVDAGEDHGAAARRELREETGYTADRWVYLGAVEPNPAFQTNLCHHWFADGARSTHAQALDEGEDIRIRHFDEAELVRRVRSGEIRHSLVLTALSRVLDLRLAEDVTTFEGVER